MSWASDAPLRVLVIDDDEVDRMMVRRALNSADRTIQIEESEDAATALKSLKAATFDCVILDYRLPGTDGLALLKQIRALDITVPVIMMTGQGDERLAVEIMKAGATDYLSKSGISSDNLLLSVRNAIRVQRAEQELAERNHHALLGAEIGVALTSSDSLQRKLQRCTEAIVHHFDAAFARIWTLNDTTQILELQASAGLYTHLDGGHSHVPVGALKIGLIAQSREPHLSNDVMSDALIDQAWATQEGMLAFAGYPLIVQEKVVGVVAIFARHTLSVSILKTLASVADELAIAIQQAMVALENERLYQQAQDAIQIRDVFLSVASHELKTPLTSLMSNVQLFVHRATRENNLNERDSRTLNIILTQATRLNKLIGALLDISRLENGNLSIQPEALDLANLVRRLVDERQITLDRHVVEFADYPDPLILFGDELRLEQVIQNLIQNAIKYSPKGGVVQVKVGMEEKSAYITVTDHGMGIPQEALPHLFDRFYRASNVNEGNIVGMGLGLSVVKEIVALHGGTIEVSSTEGVGSTFTVKLPLHDSVSETVSALKQEQDKSK